MRKHGFDSFEMVLVKRFYDPESAFEYERYLINLFGIENLLNLSPGGEGGFKVQDLPVWKNRLSKARQGRKPALGMKHSLENKTKFSDFGKIRWDKYGRYPTKVVDKPFRESHKLYGISKTHYYRLLKQARSNEPS